MKREIKFRAWKIHEKEWFIPIYEAYDGKLYDISITMNGTVMERTMQSNASMLNDENYILEQFTGLKDKNGIDIYEGDIIIDNENRYFEIIWSDYFWAIKESFFGVTGIRYNTHLMFEIIGNIHENPELI